jgi:hypothetical protein
MKGLYENGVVVARGTWLYDNSLECDVLIERLPMFYGSGDHEDPPEVRDDREQETYYISYSSPGQRGTYLAGGGCGLKLGEAKAIAEHTLNQKIDWK